MNQLHWNINSCLTYLQNWVISLYFQNCVFFPFFQNWVMSPYLQSWVMSHYFQNWVISPYFQNCYVPYYKTELFPLFSKLSFSPQYEQINEIMCMIGNLFIKNVCLNIYECFFSFYYEIVCLYYSWLSVFVNYVAW